MLPIPIKATPYAHQREAYEFACKKFGLLPTENTSNGLALLMEMGTGKTLTSTAISTILFKLRKVRRVLVVAPLSILSVWKEEFKKFADTPHFVTIRREKVAKLKNISNTGLQIVVVNYESAWRIEKELLEFDADLVIADEAHKIKDARTAQAKALHHFGDKARYKNLIAWQAETKADAIRRMYSETWCGRRRYIPDIRSDNWGNKSSALRQALNTPIQGTAADILKLAAVRILLGLPERPWLKPILQIHDELVFVVPKDKLNEAVRFIKNCMEAQPFPEFDIPLVAEASFGETFGTMEELEGL